MDKGHTQKYVPNVRNKGNGRGVGREGTICSRADIELAQNLRTPAIGGAR